MTEQTTSGVSLSAISRSLFVFAIFYGGMVPLVIALVVRIGRKLDEAAWS
jgi:hypothetical protein